ncbi:MAG: hypothetical protein HZB10_01935 [Candidatus Yonathbacteria bacterium]|nr:hypothetical protein [Candidatus Yonathbacteria bacterium]
MLGLSKEELAKKKQVTAWTITRWKFCRVAKLEYSFPFVMAHVAPGFIKKQNSLRTTGFQSGKFLQAVPLRAPISKSFSHCQLMKRDCGYGVLQVKHSRIDFSTMPDQFGRAFFIVRVPLSVTNH